MSATRLTQAFCKVHEFTLKDTREKHLDSHIIFSDVTIEAIADVGTISLFSIRLATHLPRLHLPRCEFKFYKEAQNALSTTHTYHHGKVNSL